MKTLKLTHNFKSKLDRLTHKVGDLSYMGADLASFDSLPIVAIVGTRKPTPYGKMMTQKLAEDLARAGIVIVSGLALGIDCIAHESTIKAKGLTIAVSPGGLNKIYPVTNRPIAEKIITNHGTIISEYSPNHQPRKVEFLERNRIIAALSDLVIIPEAAAGSGSLNTANHAKIMNIPIAVVPGNVTSPMSSGTNQLLVEGAKAVTSGLDVLKLLGLDASSRQQSLDLMGETPEETIILQKILLGFTDGAELQQETLLSTVDFQTAVTMLEVTGRIAQDSLGNWRLKS
jgi:DNA processing protein